MLPAAAGPRSPVLGGVKLHAAHQSNCFTCILDLQGLCSTHRHLLDLPMVRADPEDFGGF